MEWWRVVALICVAGIGAGTDAGGAAVSVELKMGGPAERGSILPAQLVVGNPSDRPTTATVEFTVQEDPAMDPAEAPDPVHGSDHAAGAPSRTEVEGKVVEEGSLTDRREWTGGETTWRTDHWTVAFQFVDLGRERNITHLAFTSGDANWTWKLDVSASRDGKTYEPVPSLQGIDLHQKWGRVRVPVAGPFAARHLKLRYHLDGKKTSVLRMPAEVFVYDGTADETVAVPQTGRQVATGSLKVELPARSTKSVALGDDTRLPSGAYFVAAKVTTGSDVRWLYGRGFVFPEGGPAPSPASRFGLNTSDVELAPLHKRLGIGWVRFENMKWPMASPRAGEYAYDGSVGPWHVPHDKIMEAYRAQGLSVLPYLFQTAGYASSAPASAPEHRRWSYPPTDPKLFGEFCFQTAARYGSAKHPAEALKTKDKRSGTGSVNVFEVWNEPNLTDPGWGPWVGTQPQYFDLFRAAAEAIKKADPSAKVTNGGYAGIEAETVDALRAHSYPDGKRPLDFVDVLNVHYYSGREAPETATQDTNAQRDPSAAKGATFEDNLRRLLAWRDQHKPGMPVWLTETGYDTAGPIGTNERVQAARLPRVVMLSLAAGVDKVFVYREKGSAPSMHAASGLLRDDGTIRPSWFTYATLIRALHGVTEGKRLPHPDPNVRVYAWQRTDGTTVLSAWAVEGEGKLGIDLGKCTLTDAFGAKRERDVGPDTKLTEFPVYVEGMKDPDHRAVR